MSSSQHSKQLLVEGDDDVYAIAELMGHHVSWGNREKDWPVYLDAAGSVDTILAEPEISTRCKSSTIQTLGIVIDANDSLQGRWQRLRDIGRSLYDEFPSNLRRDGLLIPARPPFPRFGVWIMPDNTNRGMLETFLARLVPTAVPQRSLWDYAGETAEEARRRGGACRPQHADKAHVHTWLAWQDPPGQPLGLAVRAKCLEPDSPFAGPFVEWFIRLFQLEALRRS